MDLIISSITDLSVKYLEKNYNDNIKCKTLCNNFYNELVSRQPLFRENKLFNDFYKTIFNIEYCKFKLAQPPLKNDKPLDEDDSDEQWKMKLT